MEASDSRLRGRSILLTRPDGSAQNLLLRLAALGARVESRPAISFEPPRDPEPVRRALAELERYDWLVFTSANGVRFFVSARLASGRSTARIPGGIAAIGPATSAALVKAGLMPTLVAADSRSEGLARSLETSVKSGQCVLLIRPEVAERTLVEALAGMGARCDAVPFYRSVAAPGIEMLVREIRTGRFDVVVLTSPSALQRMLELPSVSGDALLAALGRCHLVAIGPVTARAIEGAGLTPAAIAEEPSDDGILRCILTLYP